MEPPPPPPPAAKAAEEATTAIKTAATATATATATILPISAFSPELYTRAWLSIPHPSRPLVATAHDKSVTVYSLSTFSKHSSLSGGHSRSVRSVAWQPTPNNPNKLRLVTGSFDSTAGLWSYDESRPKEVVVRISGGGNDDYAKEQKDNNNNNDDQEDDDWEFNLVLEGHENEIKSVAFNPTGQYLATCSRDKSVWIWEVIGDDDEEDDDDYEGGGGGGGGGGEWETVAVLNEHEGDVKMVSWMPQHSSPGKGRNFGSDCLASASYDDTVRIWREDGDGEWVCVCVLADFGGTVWGLEWEKKTKKEDQERWPRLMTTCQDGSVKIWELKDDEEDDEEGKNENSAKGAADWSVPNRMRRELREDWVCVAELPRAHTREVYSASWSAETGVVATTGGDGRIVLYGEQQDGKWAVLGAVSAAHGAYEVNHVTWCKRWDKGTERRGEEEMLVTTGDDGVVRAWEVKLS